MDDASEGERRAPDGSDGATDPGTGSLAADPATVLLVRHGETEWNRTRRIQGWAPVSLNETGREQARAAGRHLAERYAVDRAVASDLRRTRETARILRTALGLDHDGLSFDPGWRERDFGVYQGLSYESVFEGHPEFAVSQSGAAALRATPERGESILAARERVLGALGELLAGLSAGETVLVVTHGGPIHVALADLQGRDLVTELVENSQHNCAINELRVDGADPSVVRLNATADP